MQRPVAQIIVSKVTATDEARTHHFGAGTHGPGGCCAHPERVDLAFELDVLLLGLAGTLLEVGDILCLASTIIPLLEEGARGRDGHVLSASPGHV